MEDLKNFSMVSVSWNIFKLFDENEIDFSQDFGFDM